MAQFSIKPDNAKKTVTDEKKLIRELAALEDEIRHISNSLGFRVVSSANIQGRLRSAADRVDDYQNCMNSMKNALSDVVNVYISTENAITGNDKFNWVSPFWDLVGSAGVVGGAIGTLGEFLTSSNVPGARWGELAKDVWNTGWDISDVVKTCRGDTSVKWWKEALKLNPDTFLQSIKNANLSRTQKLQHGFARGIKGTLREFKSVGGAAKQVGGIVLSGVVNAFKNYDEYQSGEISGIRAVAETITETAVDWGKDLLIGAAVTAGFAAAGIAAPAIAVGAATVAVSVGIDWICNQVCGKTATEAISDAILDSAERRAEMAAQAIESGKKIVNKGADIIWKVTAGGWDIFTGGSKTVYA